MNIVQECYFISRAPRPRNRSIFRFTSQAKSNEGPLPTIQDDLDTITAWEEEN